MALIKCPECGKEISNQSDKCINCGYPLNLVKHSQGADTSTKPNNLSNNTTPFFSNKEKANNMMTIMYCVCIPLLLLGVFMKSPINYILCGIVIVVSLCMAPSTSYIEVFSDTIKGRPSKSRKFEVKMHEVTDVTRGEREITIHTEDGKYTVNCGDECDAIIAYINQVKKF